MSDRRRQLSLHTPHLSAAPARIMRKQTEQQRPGPDSRPLGCVGMRQLARRLSRVADSSASPAAEERRGVNDKATAAVPEGHVPVHVGEGSDDGEAAERFLVRGELLGRPALAQLLGRTAQEYGYGHQGPLRIPCSPAAFRRALATLEH